VFEPAPKRFAFIATLKSRAVALETEAYALYIAVRDPRVPWYAKVFTGLVLVYAFSPIDLIPDFIPVLGYLDDLILIPLGIAFAVKMIPPEVLSDARRQAEALMQQGEPSSRTGALLIIATWLIVLAAAGWLVARAALSR
jgi:uncharacterized membrane protein YkvA (DUF1232 family)